MKTVLKIKLLIAALIMTAPVIGQPVLLKHYVIDQDDFYSATFVKGTVYINQKDSLFRYDENTNQKIFLLNVGENIYSVLPNDYLNHHFFFTTKEASGNQALWKTDGTSANTSKIGSYNSIESVGVHNSSLYLLIDDGIHGRELWRLNQSLTNLSLVKDIAAGPSSGFLWNLKPIVSMNNAIYFYGYNENGVQLWQSDDSPSGTAPIQDNVLSSITLTKVGNQIYFTKYIDSLSRLELWKTNGSTSQIVKNFENSNYNNILNPVAFRGQLFFLINTTNGLKLYKSNGTSSGTQIVKSFSGSVGTSNVLNVVADQLVFYVYGSDSTRFYRSDGTNPGTKVFYKSVKGIDSYAAVKDFIFFSFYEDYPQNMELYQSDLTDENTKLVSDIFGTPPYTNPYVYRIEENRIIFLTEDIIDPKLYQDYWLYDPTKPSSNVPYFTLVDAKTDKDIQWLKEGDVVLKAQDEKINIRYNPSGPVGSVVFKINDVYKRTENEIPFALATDDDGDYNPWNQAYPGSYKLTAIPYPFNNGNGIAGIATTINFSIKAKNSWDIYARTNSDQNPESEMESVITASPNPSSDMFNFTINPRASGKAIVEIYHIDGTLIKTLFDGDVNQGDVINLIWNSTDQKEGMYLFKYRSANESFIKKIICVK